MHCGANTNHASSASAVASDHCAAIIGASCAAMASSLPDSAYTVASAPTATSRAARPGTSAMQICQLKPTGANTFCSAWPIMPAKL
ncbi:hypothetical protein D3C81_1266750 [compost metagenome]